MYSKPPAVPGVNALSDIEKRAPFDVKQTCGLPTARKNTQRRSFKWRMIVIA